MRSNSGKDESRDNLHDPTMRDRELGRGNTATRQGRSQKLPRIIGEAEENYGMR